MKNLYSYIVTEGAKEVGAYARKYKDRGDSWMGTYTKAKAGTIYCTALRFTEQSKRIYAELPQEAKCDFSDVKSIVTDGSWSDAEINDILGRGKQLPKDLTVQTWASENVDLDAFHKLIPFDNLIIMTGDRLLHEPKVVRNDGVNYKFGAWASKGGADDVGCNVRFPRTKIDNIQINTCNYRPWLQMFEDPKMGIMAKECKIVSVMPGNFEDKSMIDAYKADVESIFQKNNKIDKIDFGGSL